ncbi:porin family protein [Sulfurovum sp.]|uniref:porin family protein n=1 Tax=Sulfurovum sp. TaxID=1969726 RepID=UPI0025F03B6F|nr:porin family protein [Sulfurovum sp.]
MKDLITKTLLTVAVLTAGMYAGGKVVAPVEAPVAVIPVTTPSPWYLGAGLVWAKLSGCDLVNCSYEDTTYGAMIRGGYDFNEYFGVEARGIRTFLDKGPFGGTPLQHIGIYAKPQYPVSERVNIYGLAGYGYTENLGNGARLNYFDNDSGFAAGIGVEFDLSDRKGDFLEDANYDRVFDGYADQGKGWSLFLDYQRMLIKSDVPDMDVVSFGLRYDF